MKRWSSRAPLPFVVLLAACSSTGSSGGGVTDGGASEAATSGTCDPTDATSCGSRDVCVAHSTGDAPGCEKVPESDTSLALGCPACRAASDCGTKDATCVEGSCRLPPSYPWVRRSSVTASDDALGARCCASGKVDCGAADANGDRDCQCAP